ncbi:MAG TPA: N,N-dimethylformamidase beta subunit family domain-containing protein, partial [Puia sp.]
MKQQFRFLFFVLLLGSCTRQGNKENKITAENRLPGTTDWLIQVKFDTCALPDHRYCRRPQIEGYCSQTSVKSGDSLNLYVSTNPASRFTIDIYRMGYYQGKGANLKKSIGPLQGKEQITAEPDPKTNFLECKWDKTYQLVIPPDWLSGVYLCKLTT